MIPNRCLTLPRGQRVRITELYRFELGPTGPYRPASHYEFASHISDSTLDCQTASILLRRRISATASNHTCTYRSRQPQKQTFARRPPHPRQTFTQAESQEL